MYDRALAIFDEDEIDHYQWGFNRARFIQSNQRDIENGRIMTMREYEALYELDPQRFIDSGDGYFIMYLVSEKVTNGFREDAIRIMNDAQPLAPQNVIDFFQETRNDLFSDPDERIKFITEQLNDASPEDRLDIKTELFDLYGQVGNREMQEQMASDLYDADKSYDNVMRMAEYAQNRGNYREAIGYFREALQLASNDTQRSRLNQNLSDSFLQLGDLQQARTFARRAMQQDSSWGTPLIQMASIYAQAVTNCTDGGLDRTDKVVYWLVIDYLERAANVDSSVASRARRDIASYRGVTPTSEEKFYMNWENGDTINVGGNLNSCYEWIGETTTVR